MRKLASSVLGIVETQISKALAKVLSPSLGLIVVLSLVALVGAVFSVCIEPIE